VDADEYRRMAAAGERHWWYIATRELLAQLVLPHLAPPTSDTRYLDAAGGSGATGRWLAERALTLVDDVDEESVRYAAGAGYRPVVADLNALPHPDDTFDAVLCVTALCHRMNADPAVTVNEMARVTKPGGAVALMEPGVRRLRRGHDRVTHTARRFSRGDLAGLLRDTGLDVVRATGAYSFLVPPAAVLAMVEHGRAASDVGRHESGLGGVLSALARAERAVLRRANLPSGLSVIAIAVKPDRPGDPTR
jgi:SAM-dependent methyltransferase